MANEATGAKRARARRSPLDTLVRANGEPRIRLEDQLRGAFERFAARLQRDVPIVARERELVSMFSFGPLLESVDLEGELFDPLQIGIEVAVRQRPARAGERLKTQVCKDLVIWPRPEMTCWGPDGTPTVFPHAVIEWKCIVPWGRQSISAVDLKYVRDWLSWFVRADANTEGYCVVVRSDGATSSLVVDRFSGAKVDLRWFATPISAPR